jgi:hypothetical protein
MFHEVISVGGNRLTIRRRTGPFASRQPGGVAEECRTARDDLAVVHAAMEQLPRTAIGPFTVRFEQGEI